MRQLVGAGEADADVGFMARLLALCPLPRSNPGNQKEFVRRNGPYALVMSAGGLNKLPYGTLPRLLLAWVCTEAVRTQSRELVLGLSLSDFMRKLDIYSASGGTTGGRTRLRNQMRRLFGCTVSLIYEDAHGEATLNHHQPSPARPEHPARVNWIAGQRARIQRPGLNADERRGRQARANVELPASPARPGRHAWGGLAVSRVTVRNQRTRWGSCGRNGHITLKWSKHPDVGKSAGEQGRG